MRTTKTKNLLMSNRSDWWNMATQTSHTADRDGLGQRKLCWDQQQKQLLTFIFNWKRMRKSDAGKTLPPGSLPPLWAPHRPCRLGRPLQAGPPTLDHRGRRRCITRSPAVASTEEKPFSGCWQLLSRWRTPASTITSPTSTFGWKRGGRAPAYYSNVL